MQLRAGRVVDAVALAQGIETVALPGVQLTRHGERIEDLAERCDLARLTGQTLELRIQERDVEGGVVDHELRAFDELQELVCDLREARLTIQLGARDAVHGERAVIDLALGIEVAVEGTPGAAPVHQLHAADLDDAMIEFGLQSRGLGVQHDLSHGARVYPNDWPEKASIASFARRSTRSLPGTPACPGTQCHSSW